MAETPPPDRTARTTDQAGRIGEALAEGILAIASDAIISVNADQRIIRFNQGAEAMFGWSSQEILGEPLDVLLPHRFRATHHEHVRRFAESPVAARRMGERQEISGLRRDGVEFPAEASISKLRGPDGWIFSVVLRDITERKRAEQTQQFLARAGALLASSIEYEPTLRSVARLAVPALADWCVIFMADAQGGVNRLELAHAEPAKQTILEEMREIPLDPRRPHPVFTAMETGEPELIAEVGEAYLRAISTDDAMYDVFRRLELRSILIAPLIARGVTRGAIGLFSATRAFADEDFTLAKELALRAALAIDNARLYQQAQRAVRARDDVLSVVTHDVGNTLTAIRIGSSLLLRGLSAEERAAGGWAHLSSVLQSIGQMERLIEDLLQVKRLEAGQLALDRSPQPPHELIDEVAGLWAPAAAEKGVELLRHVEPDADPAFVDRKRLVQVLSNLVGNAVKFTGPGGRIEIRARSWEGELHFSVRDTGRGIPASDLPHVFDRFWQGRREGRPAGVGLGLAIARGIVEAHGGRIWAESEPGVGSTFHFTVPREHGR